MLQIIPLNSKPNNKLFKIFQSKDKRDKKLLVNKNKNNSKMIHGKKSIKKHWIKRINKLMH